MTPPKMLRAATLLASAAAAAAAASSPHLIFILADDLGWNAPGYQEPQLKTPALDALAAEGAVLSSYYAYKYCSPSRASFLSGRYPYKTESTRNNLIPYSQEDGVNLNFTFLPAKLKAAAPAPYRTVHVGKWHQGLWRQAYTPTARGFDHSDGFLAGGQDHFTQQTFHECPCNQSDIYVDGAIDPSLKGQYNAVRFTEAAVAAIASHGAAAAGGAGAPPLFMFVALQNTHAPFEALPQYEALYPGVSYALQRTFDAMVSTVDASVGNITAALKAAGMWEDTLLVWASDNGSPVQVGGSNWPLRGGKGTNFEGGVRVPALVSGGYLPPAMRGTNLTGLAHVSDWYTTFCALAGVDAADGDWAPVDGVNLWPWLSGANASSPRSRIVLQHDMYTGQALGALRDGDWKLIVGPEQYASWYGAGGAPGHFSPPQGSGGVVPNPSACNVTTPCLFNIADDPEERHDLAAAMPEKVAELLAAFHSYDDQHHPPVAPPPSNASACCAVSAANGGFVAPWGPA